MYAACWIMECMQTWNECLDINRLSGYDSQKACILFTHSLVEENNNRYNRLKKPQVEKTIALLLYFWYFCSIVTGGWKDFHVQFTSVFDFRARAISRTLIHTCATPQKKSYFIHNLFDIVTRRNGWATVATNRFDVYVNWIRVRVSLRTHFHQLIHSCIRFSSWFSIARSSYNNCSPNSLSISVHVPTWLFVRVFQSVSSTALSIRTRFNPIKCKGMASKSAASESYVISGIPFF